MAEQQGTVTSGFGVIPNQIVEILRSVMEPKYFKALESGSTRGLSNDERIVLTSLRSNYGTFNFAAPAFKTMMRPLSTMGVDEIAVELNTRQRQIPPFGTVEYSQYLRDNPQPLIEIPDDTLPSRQRGQIAGAADETNRPGGGIQRGGNQPVIDAYEGPGPGQAITQNAAINQLTQYLPENYRIYFLTGIIDIARISREYPDADTTVSPSVRQDILKLRQSVISGDLDRNLAGKYFTGAGRNQGARASEAQNVVDRILRIERLPDPMGRVPEDPLGRTADTPGFGRGTEPPRTVVGKPYSGARAPSAEPPEGQEYVFNRGLNRWELMNSKTGRTVGAVDKDGKIIKPDTGDDGDDGGGGGGVPGAGIPGMETAEPMVPPDWETAAAEMYPEYYAIVKNNPEIADLLRRSLGPPEWSEQKFQAELRGTNWWKTTTASARTWDAASALDPATYQAQIDEAATAINQEALNLGIRLSSDKVQKLALDSLRFGWGTQTITNSIGMAATEGGAAGATQLREGYYGQQVRNTAKQYGVSLNDTTFNSFVNKIAVGEETIGSFQDYALTIAKSLYPPLAEQFDAGRTFEDVTSSYKTIAANLLEKDEASIDMTRPEWVQAVTYQADPKTGEQRLMNMREWQDYLRTTDSFGYQYTTEARSRAYGIADTIANMFGRI